MVGGEELTPEAFSAHRQRMVEFQIRRRGVADERVLEAMERVPRHLFVPPAARESAYDDRPLPIGGGQTISQPYVVARMAELAEIGPHDSVLEVGAGSGYAAAVFAELADRVTTVEIRPELAAMARENLDRAGYSRVEVVAGGPEAVDPERRFDAILVAAATREIPPDLEERLADGGRMVIPVGSRFSQHLWVVTRRGDDLERHRHEAVAFVPLV